MPTNTMRYEKLLEAVPDALVGMDQKGTIRFVNRQTEMLFGYDRDELIGEPIDALVPETLWQIYSQHRQDYFADPRTRSSGLEVELSGRHHNGGQFPINISMSHIDTGDVLLVITAVGDVAEQQEAVKRAGLTSAIVEYADDAIIGVSLDGTITSWNPAAERMYRHSSKEIIGKSLSVLTPQDRAGEITAFLAKVSAGQAVEHLETNRVRKDGTVVPVSITVSAIRDAEGTVVGASAVHRDVTEQRRAFEIAQRMAAIIEDSDDAIISASLDGILTSWNPAAETMYGYSAEEIIGSSAELVVSEDETGVVQAVLEQIAAGQHVEDLETKCLRKDGAVFPITVTVSPIRDADGAIIGASAVARDTTERRRAFEAAQRLAAIVDSSDDAIIGKTLDGIITSWNPAAAKMYGYSSQEMIGKPVHLLSPPERTGEIETILAKLRSGQTVDHFETDRIRKDGSVFPVSITVSPIRDAHCAIVGASTIARDVTALR
ncbi:MAG TPA: PAS domain S-box protein [Dermatophilaceae bacterium]